MKPKERGIAPVTGPAIPTRVESLKDRPTGRRGDYRPCSFAQICARMESGMDEVMRGKWLGKGSLHMINKKQPAPAKGTGCFLLVYLERRHDRTFVFIFNELFRVSGIQFLSKLLHRFGIFVVRTGNDDVHVR